MFVVLELINRETGSLVRKVRNLLTRPKVWLESGDCLGGRFAVLRAEISDGQPDWEAVERVCGAYSGRLVLPEGVEPPEGGKLRRLPMNKFENRVLLRTACELVNRTRMPMYRRILGLVDSAGSHTAMLGELLKHYTAVKVVTDNKEAYRAESDRVMRELGAPVLLGENLSSFHDCVLVLSPSTTCTDQEASFSCPVLAGGVFVALGRFELFSGLQAALVEQAGNLCPNGIRPHDFAGALYECYGVESSVFTAETLLHNYKVTGLAEAAGAMARLAGLDSSYHKKPRL